MKRQHLTETPVCPQERLLIISSTTGLSFALERIGPLTAIITIVFYLLVLYLLALSNTPENPFASIYSESLIKTACQHLLLLVVGHQCTRVNILLWHTQETSFSVNPFMVKMVYAIKAASRCSD
jgi:hypothetical protein